MKLDQLAGHIIKQAAGKRRWIVALAGPPGAGKSTAAAKINQAMALRNVRSRIVTMDGFHLDNAILQERGLLDRKGAPETFDVAGFIHLVRRLNTGEDNIFIPKFDREKDIAIAAAEQVTLADQVLIVEGNYLLLNQPPWQDLFDLWHTTIFINPDIDTLRDRLVRRWLDYGLDPAAARERATGNDLANAQTVLDYSTAADFSFASLS